MLVTESCPALCSLPGFSVHGIPRQEYWSGLPFASPGDLPNAGIKPRSPALWADSLPSESPGKPPELINNGKLIGCLEEWGEK